MATLVFTTLRFQKVFTTFNLVSLLSGNSSPWFHCAPGLCLTLYVLAIKLYWQANKKHLPTQSNKHNRKQKPKGPEPNTNNHKTATQAPREEPSMPAQNQSNQTTSKPSHYTRGRAYPLRRRGA